MDVLNIDGSNTETVTDINAAGTLQDRAVATTSANGLSTIVQYDLSGTGTFSESLSDVTIINADGSTTETETFANAGGTPTARYVETTSANGLSKTKQWDTTGAGSFDQSSTDVTTLNADGSRTETV